SDEHTVIRNAWGGYAASGSRIEVDLNDRLNIRDNFNGSYVYTLFGKGPGGQVAPEGFITGPRAARTCLATQYLSYRPNDPDGPTCVDCPTVGPNCTEGVYVQTEGYYVVD